MDVREIIKKILKEATGNNTGSRGSYIIPLQPGLRNFDKTALGPFTDEVSHYDSPLLQYDSFDGKMDIKPKQRKEIERQAEKATNYIKKHPNSTFSDEDGNNLNPTPGKGKKIVPIKESNELEEDLAVWFGKKKKPKGVKVHTLNVERPVLRVKCLIRKKNLLVNKKEERKKKILKPVKDKNQLWFHTNQRMNLLTILLIGFYLKSEILFKTSCKEFFI